MHIAKYLTSRRKMIDSALDKYVPGRRTYPPEIHRAMRYSLFPGGKRFRAILVIASSETVRGSFTQKSRGTYLRSKEKIANLREKIRGLMRNSRLHSF